MGLGIIGFPAIVLGWVAQHALAHVLQSEKLRLLLWMALAVPSAFLVHTLYQHGLDQMITKELTAYILAVKHSQLDLMKWDYRSLWTLTWPVWMRTLVAVPLAGVWSEVSFTLTGSRNHVSNTLRQQEQKRQRRKVRNERRAEMRTHRPEHLPDVAGKSMIIGVPIKEEGGTPYE